MDANDVTHRRENKMTNTPNPVPLMSDSMDSDDDSHDINDLYDSDNNMLPPGLKPITPPQMSSSHGRIRNGSMVLTFDCDSQNAESEMTRDAKYETYELLNSVDDIDSEDIDENAPFPDIAKIGRGARSNSIKAKSHETRASSGSGSKSVGGAQDDPRFAIVVSDENHSRIPLTPPKKQKRNSIIVNGPLPLSIPPEPVPRLQTSQSNNVPTAGRRPPHLYIHHKQNQSLNFNGLSTSSTKKLTAHQMSTTELIQDQARLDFYNPNGSSQLVKAVVTPPIPSGARDVSFHKVPGPMNQGGIPTTDVYYYTYPDYSEYESDCEDNRGPRGKGKPQLVRHRANTMGNIDIEHYNGNGVNVNEKIPQTMPLKPLRLSPKNSDEPVAEMNLAEINDHTPARATTNTNNNNNNGQFLKTISNSIHGYNSGSDDTIHYESSSNYDTPSPIVKLPRTRFTRSSSTSPLPSTMSNTLHNITQHHLSNLVLDDIMDHHHVTKQYNANKKQKADANSNSNHPYHRMPITPKHRSCNFEGDGNVSEEDTNGLTEIINNSKRKHVHKHSKQSSFVISYNRQNSTSTSTSNPPSFHKPMSDFGGSNGTLKLLNQESQCEGQDPYGGSQGVFTNEDENSHDSQPQPSQHSLEYCEYNTNSEYSHTNTTAGPPSIHRGPNIISIMDDTATATPSPVHTDDDYVSLHVIAQLAKIKDTDARAIWMQACSEMGSNSQYAYLVKLYPFLVKKFQVTTRTKNRYPQIQQLEHYFLRMGGKYLRNTNFPVIHITKYNKFYSWFTFMCSVVSELRMIYDDYNLDCLFYGKRTSSEILKMRPQGTFILSLTNKTNCLSLRYRKSSKNHDISTIILFRHSRDLYSVNKSKKKASLYQIIRPRTYLKYLYTPQMLIDKKALF